MTEHPERLGAMRALVDGLLPELPGGRRQRWAVLTLLVGVMIVDAVWFKRAVFGSAIWRACSWGMVVAGLLAGIIGRWRRR